MTQPKFDDYEQFARFFEDVIYVEESNKRGMELPAVVLYFLYLTWRDLVQPTWRLSYTEFETVCKKYLHDYTMCDDGDAVAYWKHVSVTTFAGALLIMNPPPFPLDIGGGDED